MYFKLIKEVVTYQLGQVRLLFGNGYKNGWNRNVSNKLNIK